VLELAARGEDKNASAASARVTPPPRAWLWARSSPRLPAAAPGPPTEQESRRGQAAASGPGPAAARSPKLRRALAAARDAGHAYVVIDGTLVPIDRVAADRPFYSGKHRRHGMNLQVIATPGGDIVWVSGPLPRRGP
jgi:DDE superfamily endonuclease